MFSGPDSRTRSNPFSAIRPRSRSSRCSYSALGKTDSPPCGTDCRIESRLGSEFAIAARALPAAFLIAFRDPEKLYFTATFDQFKEGRTRTSHAIRRLEARNGWRRGLSLFSLREVVADRGAHC